MIHVIHVVLTWGRTRHGHVRILKGLHKLPGGTPAPPGVGNVDESIYAEHTAGGVYLAISCRTAPSRCVLHGLYIQSSLVAQIASSSSRYTGLSSAVTLITHLACVCTLCKQGCPSRPQKQPFSLRNRRR